MLVNSNGKIHAILLLPNTTNPIQPKDQGIIATCKRHYQWHYLNEGLLVLEESEDLIEDTKRAANSRKHQKVQFEEVCHQQF